MASQKTSKPKNEKTPRERFLQVCGNRVGSVLHTLELIGKASNTRQYEYTAEDVTKWRDAVIAAANKSAERQIAALQKTNEKGSSKSSFDF